MYIYVDKYLIYGKIREVRETMRTFRSFDVPQTTFFGQKTNARQRRKHEKR